MQIEKYKWKNRLLLMFAPTVDHPDYKRQQELISAEKQGLKERDLLVLDRAGIGEAENQKLRKQYNVETQGFAIILLGKDGKEKHRSQKPVAMQDIFKIIDQMPMRQQEMRGQGND